MIERLLQVLVRPLSSGILPIFILISLANGGAAIRKIDRYGDRYRPLRKIFMYILTLLLWFPSFISAEGAGAMYGGLGDLPQIIGLSAGFIGSQWADRGNGIGGEAQGVFSIFNASFEVVTWTRVPLVSPRVYIGFGIPALQVQRGFGNEAGSTRLRSLINLNEFRETSSYTDIFWFPRDTNKVRLVIGPFLEEYDQFFSLKGLRWGLSLDIMFWP